MANKQENIKVYLYTRVSTAMQVDGYSLDAQKAKMKAFCEFNNCHIHARMDYNEQNRKEGIFRYDVGVDANNFYPISVKQIIDFFSTK